MTLLLRLRRCGIRIPWRMVKAARRAHLNIPLAASILIQESAGGINEFGHDPTIYVGAGRVTRKKYLCYKRARGPQGAGGMQGVGPCQLTWWAYQDAADKLGGCWRPLCNMTEGFTVLADLIRRNGLHAGVAAYNGTGPVAQAYADTVVARARGFAPRLKQPAP